MSEPLKIRLVAGARPNFMKIAPLWREFQRRPDAFATEVVHTGQHYDYAMSQVFFEQLELPEPHYFLEVGSGSHGKQTAEVLARFEELLIANRPDLVVVVGDVNSTMAAALAAAKMGIPVAHVEAGLRSFDRTMPEEINRVVTDRISDLLLASEPSALKNLSDEGIDAARVHLVGNLMIDTLAHHLPRIRREPGAEQFGLSQQAYGLLTLHRPSNVDTAPALRAALGILRDAAQHAPLVWPIHPRTAKSIEAFEMAAEFDAVNGLTRVAPLGYFEFMRLMIDAAFVLTDSGGIQEETTWLGVPCITLRENTERPITVEQGTNRLTGVDPQAAREALQGAMGFDRDAYRPFPLWDGKAASRVADVISGFLGL